MAGTFENAITEAIKNAPDLAQMPGVAVAAGSTQDPGGNAQALAQVAQMAATTQAYQQVKQRHGWLDSAVGDLTGLGSSALHAAGQGLSYGLNAINKPLQEVQHEYRYIRNVYQQKGVGAGIAVSLGTALGAVGGFALGGGEGAVLGAEGATSLMGRLGLYKDVWDQTGQPGQGSVGSDVSNLVLGQKNGWLSGVVNGIFDLTLDPVAQAAGVGTAARSAEGAGGLLGNVLPGLKTDIESVDAARQFNPYYNGALRDIAKMTPADVGHYYPKLAPIADRLGEATSADQVHQVFRDLAKVGELTSTTDQLPSLTLTRQALNPVTRPLTQNAPGVVDRFLLRPFEMEPAAWDAETKTFSNRSLDPSSPAAPEVIRRIARIGETNQVANDLANQYANATTFGERRTIFENTVFNALMGRAKLDPETADPNVIRAMKDAASQLTTFGDGEYIQNMDGNTISKITDAAGNEVSAGARANQTGSFTIPDFTQMKRASQAIGGYNKIFGTAAAADDWLYSHITQGIFKPLVTANLGFGQRISLSELIPQALHQGVLNTVKTVAAQHYANLGLKVADDEAGHIGSAVYMALGGDEGLLANTHAVQNATKQILTNDGQMVHPALSADHGGGFMDAPPVEKKTIDLRKAAQTNGNIAWKYGSDFGMFERDNANFIPYWHGDLSEAAKDPASQAAAQAAKAVVDGGSTKKVVQEVLAKEPKPLPPLGEGENYVRNLSRYAHTLYRETDTQGAATLLEGGEHTLGGASDVFVANHPDLALGQGANKGVMVEVDPVNGYVSMTKPAAPVSYQAGQAEFSARGFSNEEMRKAIRRVVITPDAPDGPSKMMLEGALENKGFVRIDRPDGSVAWVRPDYVKTSTVQGAVDVQAARDAGAMAAAKYIREHPDIYSDKFQRVGVNQGGMDWADHWGRVLSEGMFGSGAGYKIAENEYGINKPILDAIAAGTPLDKATLESVPWDQRPIRVKGRELAPDTQGTVQRIANFGHRKFISPIVNNLSRAPLFQMEWNKQFDALVEHGLGEDTAAVLANQRAAENILPMIHNTTERSQLGHTVRNFMPFYFAQEQAYRRAGRLLESDPAAFRKYQMLMTGMVNAGTPTSDNQGNGFLAMPGTGFLTQGTTKALSALGVPIAGSVSSGLSGNLKSLNTVFPFVEDPVPWHKPGPVVAIPLKALENLRPEIGPITDAVIGDRATAGSLWDQIIPNQFVKNALQAMGARGLTTSQYNTTLNIMQRLADQGQLPNPNDPMAQQTFVDRAKNQARILDGVKALVSLISPTAPKVDIGGQFSDLANQYIKKYGDLGMAMDNLTRDHPDATAETVFKSTTPIGEKIPAYAESQAWIDQNQALIHQFPHAAAYLVPQMKGDAFNQSVYNEQLAQHLRQRKTPEQFLKDIYTAAGNAQFYGKDLPAHQAAVDQLVASGDMAGAKAERTSFQNYIAQDFGPKNPVWWSQYQNTATKDQNKQQAIAGLVEIFAKKLAPDTEQSKDVQQLLGDWAVHQAALQPGVASNVAAATRTAENASWDQYLQQLAKAKPNLIPIINSLFRDSGEKALTDPNAGVTA